MTTYGTDYGGWYIPDKAGLNTESVVISAGVGEDISFDLAIQAAFGCRVVLVDPTERAITHFKEIQEFYEGKRREFSGKVQPGYIDFISKLKPDMSKITYIPIGLWDSATTLKFYKQDNPAYVSQTLIPGMFTQEYTEVPVDRLKSIMTKYGIERADIVKMDIEGAELAVLKTMIEDGILPQLLCVEFDYLLKGSPNGKALTQEVVEKLRELAYKIVYNQKWNIVFQRAH